MANHKSAKSRIVRNNKRAIINGARRSRVRTFIKKVEAAIAAGDKELAASAFKTAESEMMRAVRKGVFKMNNVLSGIRVLDFTQVLAGPFCTMNLADFGAEVIKIEKPGVGEGSRIFGPFINGQSGYYTLVNRGKKGITLDLKKGKDIIYDMVKSCDVVVENFYEWNVEEKSFVGGAPHIAGMNLADNLLAYIERKLFTLNTGHAITAYLGRMKGLKTIDESIADAEIFAVVKAAMQQSGEALVRKFGFDHDAHFKYIDKIIGRFKNPYLKDDVARVGREPLRKLSSTDRLVKPMMTAREYGLPCDKLLLGIGAALHYNNPEDPQSVQMQQLIAEKGLNAAVAEITSIPAGDPVIGEIAAAYAGVEKIVR